MAVDSGKVQELEAARQELSLKLENAQQQMEVSRIPIVHCILLHQCACELLLGQHSCLQASEASKLPVLSCYLQLCELTDF